MSASVTMTYGSYTFSPVPSFTINRNSERTPGLDFCLSTPLEIQLDGIIFPTGVNSAPSGGFENVTNEVIELNNIFKCGNCETFRVRCDTDPYVFDGPAKVTSFSVQPRNDSDLYVNTAGYSITLEMVSRTGTTYDNQPSGITAISEEWDFEIFDERVAGTSDGPKAGTVSVEAAYQVSHNVAVTAPFICTGDYANGEGKIGWENAADYIIEYISYNSPESGVTGLFLPTGLGSYNHFRTVSKNVYDGTINLSETWLLCTDSGYEEFDVNVDTSLDTYLTNVSVNGNIQGLANVNYANPNSSDETPKIAGAFGKWRSVSGEIYSRANTVYLASENINQSGNTMPLHIDPLNTSFGYNNKAGTVTYSYTYNNRPYNCVSNARLENITFNENNPTDVFASLTILGRTAGPLFQDIGTSGARTKEISIEAVLPVWDSGRCKLISSIGVGIPTGYDELVNSYQSYLTGVYSGVFVNSDNKNWNPKDGRFSWNKSWTVGGCS